MELVNLTPHKISIFNPWKKPICDIPVNNSVARVNITTKKEGKINKIPIVRTNFGEVEGLPTPSEETMYIVSLLTAAAVSRSERTTEDLLVPTRIFRTWKGDIIGCRALSRV